MLKDLINFPNLGMGGVSRCPIGLGQSPSQGMFPKENLSKSCSECEVDWGKTSRHGVLDIQGFVLSHLWVPL
jgi:hypothetical protein